MSCPCATLARPGGRPVPSGRTSMSQPAISAGVAALPKPKVPAACTAGVPASTTASIAIAARRHASEHLDIAHFSGLVDAPGLDRVVVIDRAAAAHGTELTDRRLH